MGTCESNDVTEKPRPLAVIATFIEQEDGGTKDECLRTGEKPDK